MILEALKWRIVYLKLSKFYFYWFFRQLFDCSKNEQVNSISVVVTGRNDNYGGEFAKRLQTTLDWNLSKLPNPELIYVEWNRIKDVASDCEWISQRYKNSKCYVIGEDIHESIATNPKIKMLEYHAKNVGIRKAKNEWILLINADVFLGLDIAKNIKMLNKNTIYGSHYKNIEWDGNPINEKHVNDKSLIKAFFATNKYLESVVGNFILTHKNNWLNATGYDESLTMVRLGVDTNGLKQLLYTGLKTMVLGHHYHLDHKESALYGKNDTHGEHDFDNIPYKNPESWGMTNYKEVSIGNNIWELKKI
ncbi:MAG: hypothetical protein A2X02_09000 [Bacteroidetes bacterium GWF2_29_10]|nr:MAG: hypothetical protein A2X02_09000 [Bacteroidetes bacterium GWF2_29_10]